MKIEKQPRDDHQVTLTVEVEQERMDVSKKRAARRLASRGKIPGFRPGKAPYDVVRRYYGDAAIIEEAIELLVDEIYPQALEQAEIEPAAAGSLDNVESMEPPKFVFTVPLRPDVDLGNYTEIRLPYEFTEPEDAAVDQSIEELRRMYSSTETVERAVQDGDFVLADVTGKQGEEEIPSATRTGFAVYVAKTGKDDEWPYKGFSKELIGLEPAGSVTVSKKFPKKHENEEWAGKEIEFTATIKTVRSMNMPELDDDFARNVGPFETLDALRDVVRGNLAQQAKSDYDDEYFSNLLDKIKEKASIKYPPQVVEHEMEHVLSDISRRLAQQGLEFDAYLKMQKTDLETFKAEEVRPVAINRLERSLIMDKIADIEKIEVSGEDLSQEYTQTLGELQSQGFEFDKITGGKQGQEKFANAVAVESANRVMVRMVLERMKTIAIGEAEKETPGETEEKPAKKKTSAKKKEKKVDDETSKE